MINDYVPLISLLLGGGVGVTGVSAFFWLGRKAQELDERARDIVEVKDLLSDREEEAELVRTLQRDFGDLKDDLKALLDDHAGSREELARNEERVNARLTTLERDLRRIDKYFSQTFPRVRSASSPDLDPDKDK